MSASTSSAPPSALGECVVCGKESATRCSKCAEGGVKWMSLCSVEHQKLMWPLHKQVCGHAFQWPSLQAKEVQEMFDLSTVPSQASDGEVKTWLDTFERDMYAEDRRNVPIFALLGREAMFKNVIQGLAEPLDGSETQQILLAHCRAVAFDLKRRSSLHDESTNQDLFVLIAADPLGMLAFSQRKWLPSLLDHLEASWYSEFQHRMLVLIASLVSLHHALQSLDEAKYRLSMGCLQFVTARTGQFARDAVKVVDRSQAVAILETYLPELVKDVGMERYVGAT